MCSFKREPGSVPYVHSREASLRSVRFLPWTVQVIGKACAAGILSVGNLNDGFTSLKQYRAVPFFCVTVGYTHSPAICPFSSVAAFIAIKLHRVSTSCLPSALGPDVAADVGILCFFCPQRVLLRGDSLFKIFSKS